MKLLYSSHGEASEIYKKLAPVPLGADGISLAVSVFGNVAERRGGIRATVLDRREIKALVQRSDPKYFLFLRELSLHMRKAYKPHVNGLLSLGYTPVSRMGIRFHGGTDPVEILAAGVLAALCGVKELAVSFDRATVTPEIASACRLCGIEHAFLCTEPESAAAAVYGTGDIEPVSRLLCVGTEQLGFASSIAREKIECIYYPASKATIFVLFGNKSESLAASDIECCKRQEFPIIITSDENTASRMTGQNANRDGYILVTSGDDESRAILEKCGETHARLYGDVPDNVCGIRADRLPPLMLSATAPELVYPYKPTDFLVPPQGNSNVSVAGFASSIAKFVGKNVFSDEESAAIGERLPL